jgi:hypothetical protein
MRRMFLLQGLLFLIFVLELNAQPKQKVKYCFCQSHRLNGKVYTPKQQLKDLLKEYTKFATYDKRNKIRFITKEDTLFFQENLLSLPDSINDIFTIINIDKKKNNYTLKKNRLVKQSIYLIDIAYPDGQNDKYFQIISIDNNLYQKKKKIKVGDQVKMKIFSFFLKNRFLIKDNEKIAHIVPSLQNLDCFLFENIWVVDFPFGYRNYFETPNLDGLYYIENP